MLLGGPDSKGAFAYALEYVKCELKSLRALVNSLIASRQPDWNETNDEAPDYIKNKPSTLAGQIQSDYEQSDIGDVSFIKNKPDLAEVATSGDYADLINTPSPAESLSNLDTYPTQSAAVTGGLTTGEAYKLPYAHSNINIAVVGAIPATTTFYYGYGSVPTTVGGIVAGTSGTTDDRNFTLVGDFGNVTSDTIWYAELVSEVLKYNWYNTAFNNGTIGVGELFSTFTTISQYRLTQSNYPTLLTGNCQFRSGSYVDDINTPGLNGKSAYQIALDNGFVGTEPDWLNALNGNPASLINDSTPSTSNVYSSQYTKTQLDAKFTLPTFNAGSVVISNGTTLIQDNLNLFWDNTNKYLGIGKNTPAYSLDTTGAIKTTQLRFATSGSVIIGSDNYPVMQIIGPYQLTIGQTFNYFLFQAATRGVSYPASYDFKCDSTVPLSIRGTGIGINNNTPTAKLHIAVGTIVAGTAPIKLTTASAALLTTPEAGALETDGTDLYWTNNAGVRKKVTIS